MSWLYLVLAITLEVSGTVSMKLSEGFTRWVPSVLVIVFYVLSVTCLTFALKKLEVSVSYAIWAGLGTALVALVGIFYFREPVTMVKLISIGLIIIGVVGLNLGSGAD